MSNINSFVKIARELQITHENEVVKVAGLLDRLKKWWKNITNPHYRESVSLLQDENAQVQEQIELIQEELNNLSQALEDGDLKLYSQTLKKTKGLIGRFVDELEDVDKKAKQVFTWTIKEMQNPGFLSSLIDHLPKDYDLELGKAYENVPLKDFTWYQNVDPKIYMHDQGSNSVFNKLLSQFIYEIGEEKFNQVNIEQLRSNLENAIINGTVVMATPLRPQKGSKAQAGQTEVTVLTQPFEIPGISSTAQLEAILKDTRTSLKDKKRLSLRGTKNLYVSRPKVATAQTVNQVPYQRTQLGEVEFAEAMREGYRKVFGEDPSAEILAGGWAQAALESGRPIKLPNNNVGNIKATKSWIASGNPFFTKGTIEFTPDGKKFKEHGAVWRAYLSPADGAAGYWKLLERRYGRALDWFSSGDPQSASVALGMKGYFTAPISEYSGAVGSLYKYFMENIAPKLSGLESKQAPPPGNKPEIKKWVADYSKEEKEQILDDNKMQQPSNDNSLDEQVDQLVNKLLAADHKGNLTKMVKNNILSKTLPETDVLIMTGESAPFEARLEYARVASKFLKNVLEAETEICTNGDQVEIQCTALGSTNNVLNAVAEISHLVTSGMRNKTGYRVKPTIIDGLISMYAEAEPEVLMSNYRKFNLQRIKNG